MKTLHVMNEFLRNDLSLSSGTPRSCRERTELPLKGRNLPKTFAGDPKFSLALALLWDVLVGHSCATLLRGTLVGHSCGALLCVTLMGHSLASHSCRTLLVGHSYTTLVQLSLCGTFSKSTQSHGTLLWDNFVGQSCGTLL